MWAKVKKSFFPKFSITSYTSNWLELAPEAPYKLFLDLVSSRTRESLVPQMGREVDGSVISTHILFPRSPLGTIDLRDPVPVLLSTVRSLGADDSCVNREPIRRPCALGRTNVIP